MVVDDDRRRLKSPRQESAAVQVREQPTRVPAATSGAAPVWPVTPPHTPCTTLSETRSIAYCKHSTQTGQRRQ